MTYGGVYAISRVLWNTTRQSARNVNAFVRLDDSINREAMCHRARALIYMCIIHRVYLNECQNFRDISDFVGIINRIR